MTANKETTLDDADLDTVQGGIALPKNIEQWIYWIKDPPLVPKPKPHPLGWEPGSFTRPLLR